MASVIFPTTISDSLFVGDPFSFTFSSDYPNTHSLQFTDSSATLLQYTNAGNATFASLLGAVLPAVGANLIVDAVTPTQGNVSLYAGDGVSGSDDGPISTASFRGPTDAVFDASGNMYIADSLNNFIRKIDVNGIVSVYAGSGLAGFADGILNLASANLNRPTALAIDTSAQLIYVVDTNNHAIRMINMTAGTLSTIAGPAPSTVEPGSADGVGNASRFRFPLAIAFDRTTSNLFVADTENHTIRKIAPGAVVTTFAGIAGTPGTADGLGTLARFRLPGGVTASNGVVFVSDTGNHTIRRLASNASVTTYAGFPGLPGFSNAVGTFARFNGPQRSLLDASGSLYVADTRNHSVRKIFPTGEVTTYAGIGSIGNVNGLSTVSSFNNPGGVAQDLSSTVFVADTQNNTIRSITPTEDARPGGSRVPGTVIVATRTYPVSILSRLEVVTAIPPILGNVIQLYQYEPYTYVVRKNRPGDSIRASASSAEITFVASVSDISFASTSGYALSYSYPLQFIVEALNESSVVVDRLSNTVRVGPGRWDISQTPPYLFHRGESIGTDYRFSSGIPITQAFVTPSLPVGLTFTQDPCSTQLYRLLGTPLLQTATSNYTFIGRGSGGRIITTSNVTIRVDAERLVLTGGPSNVTGMSVGTDIPQITLTCSTPTTNTNLFQFIGDPLPSGLTYADASANPVSLPYTIPNGTPKILSIRGAPTQAAATSFQLSAVNRLFTSNVRVRASLGTLTTDANLSFTFGPTVLFTTQYSAFVGPRLFVGIPLQSNVIYKAATFFANTTNTITSITASSLPPGLSLNFISDASGAYLTGTPTTQLASPALYTLTATDSGGNVGSIVSDIPIVQNTVTFDYSITPAIDTSFSFIQSRVLSNAKPGFYTEPITFKTTSLAGFATTFTMTGLEGSGIVLSNLGSGSALLTGLPTAVVTPVTATIHATDGNASASTTIRVEVLPDQYTFNTLTPSQLAFLQNRVIVPLQISANTVSERAVQIYSSLDTPPGLNLSPRGLLSGTPTGTTGGTFTVTATNGVSSGSQTYTYTVVPDSVLIVSPANILQLTPGNTVGPFPIAGLSYSGRTVSNFVFSNLAPTYGMTLTSTPGTGILGGLLTSSLPPSVVLPASDTFQILGSAGTVDGSANFILETSNALVYRTFASWYNNPLGSSFLASDTTSTQWNTASPIIQFDVSLSFVSDVQVRTTNPVEFNSNTFVVVTSAGDLFRSTNGRTFVKHPDALPIYNVAHITGTNTWVGIGSTGGASLRISPDDGLTWDVSQSIPGLSPRSGGFGGVPGVIVRYRDGVLMAGGTSMVRSAYDGTANWSAVTGGLASETWDFSLDANRWIAVGSDSNVVNSVLSPMTPGNTIVYSDDLGETWTGSANGYSYTGLTVARGSNGWVSTGIDYESSQYQSQIKYSTNGDIWVDVSLGITMPPSSGPPGGWPANNPELQRIGPVSCTGDVWNVLVSYRIGGTVATELYQHDVSTDLEFGWTRTDITAQFPALLIENRFTGLLGPLYMPQIAPFATTLTYTDLATAGGPTFTSPSQTEYIVYQYIPITPITVAATGANTRLFVRDEDLPVGLVFDTLTGIISGRPIEVGERQQVPIYARDATGITVSVLIFTVLVPRVTRQQSSASAYTSLVQQYTLVNSAQNARDQRAFPDQLRTLGSFLSPGVPDVDTQESNPNCVKKNC